MSHRGPSRLNLIHLSLLPALLALLPACQPPPGPPAEAPEDTAPSAPAVPAAEPVRDTMLEATLREVIQGLDGRVGVAVLHLQRETRAAVDGDLRLPLASVYKLPIAVVALQDDRMATDDTVTVTDADRAPGDTPFAPGDQATVARLVEQSLAHSDNTASDVLLRITGGSDQVARRLARQGIRDVRVDRPMSAVFADWRTGGAEAFLADPRDSGTPDGVAAVLAAVHHGRGLDPQARELLLRSLQAADTGPRRIRAGVPEGTTVAHKTGTLGPLTHDAGIISLPDGGHVILTILIQSDAPLPQREALIASLARTIWTHFTP